MPNDILKIILKPMPERSIFEVAEVLKYWLNSDINSQEWRYAYKLDNIFQ